MEQVGLSASNGVDFEQIFETVLHWPIVSVNRENFLREKFSGKIPSALLAEMIDTDPISVGCSRAQLNSIAKDLVNQYTLKSSGISFAAGLPGGFAMAATIPADMAQFMGVSLRMAQEIAYLYGMHNIWNGNEISQEAKGTLILYYGTMFGVGGASAAVRMISSAAAKQTAKRLPQIALTKTLYYPIVKQTAKLLGVKMTKDIFAKGVSKFIPLIGGVVSGGLTFATMRPMGLRLAHALDQSQFAYNQDDMDRDLKIVMAENV